MVLDYLLKRRTHIVVASTRFEMVQSIAELPECEHINGVVLDDLCQTPSKITGCISEFFAMAYNVIAETYFQPVPKALPRTLIVYAPDKYQSRHSCGVPQSVQACTQALASSIVHKVVKTIRIDYRS